MTGDYDAGIDSAWQSINQKSIQKNFHSRKQEQQKQFEINVLFYSLVRKELMTGLQSRVNTCSLIKKKNKISTQFCFNFFVFKPQ
ncbi:hypothetical protein EGX60_16225 [Escherichia coli]|nr:hypothetical protein [Escherichia coli]EFN7687818.1 hypothetical protein [Escherichia coli]EFN7755761.1 hypothetical protein [Escherichia coli]EFN7805888.1 hypothetical protein [Escherichia coli]EFN8692511.1 hypothetical protein [Escherichia coli]